MAGYKVAGSHVFWNRVVDYIIQGWLWICRRKDVVYKEGHMSDGMDCMLGSQPNHGWQL